MFSIICIATFSMILIRTNLSGIYDLPKSEITVIRKSFENEIHSFFLLYGDKNNHNII